MPFPQKIPQNQLSSRSHRKIHAAARPRPTPYLLHRARLHRRLRHTPLPKTANTDATARDTAQFKMESMLMAHAAREREEQEQMQTEFNKRQADRARKSAAYNIL